MTGYRFLKSISGAKVTDRIKFLKWLDYLIGVILKEVGSEATFFTDYDDRGRLVLDYIPTIITEDECTYDLSEVVGWFRDNKIPINTGNPLIPGQEGSGSPGSSETVTKRFGNNG